MVSASITLKILTYSNTEKYYIGLWSTQKRAFTGPKLELYTKTYTSLLHCTDSIESFFVILVQPNLMFGQRTVYTLQRFPWYHHCLIHCTVGTVELPYNLKYCAPALLSKFQTIWVETSTILLFIIDTVKPMFLHSMHCIPLLSTFINWYFRIWYCYTVT